MYYIHIDADSFFTSAESVFRPEWRGLGLAVLSNNDGTVIACNAKAKASGVRKFTPYFQISKLCKQNGVVVCSSNYSLYLSISKQMMETLKKFGDSFFQYSIDECFLTVDEIGDLRGYASLIRKTVMRNNKLPVSVGIAKTLTLAKLATHFAKISPKNNGVFVIENPKQIRSELSTIPVIDIWGCGGKTTEKLCKLGIKNALQLTDMSLKLAQNLFSVELSRTILELNGHKAKHWDQSRADKKQIFSTRSLGSRIVSKDYLMQALCTHAAIAARKARKQSLNWTQMIVFAANSPFDPLPVCYKQDYIFSAPTNSTADLCAVITKLIDRLFYYGVNYYRVGVGLSGLSNEEFLQHDLFEGVNEKKRQAMVAFDNINRRYGNGALFFASEGVDKSSWEMKRERLTPNFLNSWDDIPVVYC